MNRLQINLIIFLMSIALLGIISVQLLWIRNAIAVKEAQFDQATFEAMNDAIAKVESYDAAHYISNNVKFVNSCGGNSFTLVSADSLFDFNLNDSMFQEVIFTGGEDEQENETTVYLSVSPNDSDVVNIHQDEKGRVWTAETEFVTADENELVIIDEFESPLVSSPKIVSEKIISNNSTNKIRQNIEYKVSTISRAVKQLVFEYATEDESIRQRLDVDHINKIISTELQNKNLPSEFNYAITNEEIDSLYIVKSKDFIEADLESKYKVNVFPHDLNQKSSFLTLSFPGKNSHLLSSVLMLSLGSLIFILIIIITFSFTIYIILRQKKISEIKTDFINNMTHEFKTPIATISLATDSINNPKIIGSSDQVKFYTGIIKEENRRMNAQVENILQMSLIDKKELELNIAQQDAHSLLKRAIQNIQLQVSEKKGSIKSSLEAKKTAVMADEVHFINLVNNLLDNALKYTDGVPEIEIATFDVKNEIRIDINDKGMGMSNDKLNKIFDKFYRVQMGNIHNIKGFGLGLSYVKAVVETFRGRIEVKSELGKGSMFSIYLPVS